MFRKSGKDVASGDETEVDQHAAELFTATLDAAFLLEFQSPLNILRCGEFACHQQFA